MLIFMMQFGTAHLHATAGNPLEPLLALVLASCVGAVGLPLIQLLVTRSRNALRGWRARRRLLRAAANAEKRARALMGELCPNGWRAQITMFAAAEAGLDSSSNGQRAPVALDWMELEGESGQAAVVRRVWAPTIVEALDAMVTDRATDEALEQIERGAVADGSPWPDP